MTRKVLEPVTEILDSGTCEPFKAGVHGVVMALAAVCAAYNAAAWLKRRQRHLAVNAVFYATTVWFERCHVRHHLAECERSGSTPVKATNTLSEAACTPEQLKEVA